MGDSSEKHRVLDKDKQQQGCCANVTGNNMGGWLFYLQCYFVAIATILGTGILGLPVTLSHAGFYPFLALFIVGFIVQAILIYLFTELLQRAHIIMAQVISSGIEKSDKKAAKPPDTSESLPLKSAVGDNQSESEDEAAPSQSIPQTPSLFVLGNMFLPNIMKQLFGLIMMLLFISLLTSYALAGSQAYSSILKITDTTYVLPVFVWVLTFVIVFVYKLVQPIVSILTFAKGSVLVATVCVTLYVGSQISQEIKDDWRYIGAPFLMGTVALGGTINTMPMMFSKLNKQPTQIARFRFAIIAGLLTCTVLNIGWCWSLLSIVPQQGKCTGNFSDQTTTISGTSKRESDSCLSLEHSADAGEISTIPLSEILMRDHPNYSWVALLIDIFIIISITVSFMTIGAAMHHTLYGWLDSIWTPDPSKSKTDASMSPLLVRMGGAKSIVTVIVSLLAFGVVFAVGVTNPKGFVTILDKAVSLFLNLESGVFFFTMLTVSRKGPYSDLKIPMTSSAPFYYGHYVVLVYFTFAVIYDIFEMTYSKTTGHGLTF